MFDLNAGRLESEEPESPVRAALLNLCGEQLRPDLTGALFWHRMSVLIVADLHLEKAAAMALRGAHLPPYDTPDTLAVIEQAAARHSPAMIIALGDSFHRADSHRGLTQAARSRIKRLTSAYEWIWILGNHDPSPPDGLGGEARVEFELGPFMFRHEPRNGRVRGEIAGHLHPAAKVSVRGRTLRRRCFVTCGSRLVMPAMGSYTGGLNVLDRAFSPLLPKNGFHAWMIGSTQIHRVAARKLKADRPSGAYSVNTASPNDR